jgi:hypothetical protein
MNDDALLHNPAPRRWWRWLWLLPLWPLKAIPATDRMPRLIAWALHLSCIAAAAGVVMALNAWEKAPIPLTAKTWWDGLDTEVKEFLSWCNDSQGWAALLTALVFIELSVWVLGLLACAWAAGHETRWRQSVARAIGRLWRLSPFLVLLIALGGASTVSMSRHAQAWHQAHPFNTTNRVTQPEWDAYQASQPWSVRYANTLAADAVVLLVTGGGFMALAALGHPGNGRRPRCTWPALCEGCGYALVGLRRDQTCPECGRPVVDSLDEALRPGPAWEHRRELGCFRAAWRTCWTALLRPRRLGASLRILDGRGDHRRFALWVLALLIPGGVVGLWTGALVTNVFTARPWVDVMPDALEMSMSGAILGLFGASAGTLLMLTAGSVIGSVDSSRFKRNLLPAAAQASSYVSPLFFLWAAAYGGLAMTFTVLEHNNALQHVARFLGMDEALLVILSFAAVTLILLAIHLGLIVQIMRACPHANR